MLAFMLFVMGTFIICSATFWDGNTDFVKIFLILLNLLDSTLTFIPKTAFDSRMASNFLSSSKWIAVSCLEIYLSQIVDTYHLKTNNNNLTNVKTYYFPIKCT